MNESAYRSLRVVWIATVASRPRDDDEPRASVSCPVALLRATLDEEKDADAVLTRVEESAVNAKAA